MMKKLMIALVAFFLVGCGQATNDVSQLEPDTVDQEEVQETEETEEETEEESTQAESSDNVNPETANAPTETQPADVQTESAIVQSQPVQETAQVEPAPVQQAPAAVSEEDLAYDGDLGDADLYPNQPMFIDGVLYSGDTSGVPADMITTAGDLRVLGYTVYELTFEEYNQLMQDVNNGVIPYEEVMSHYLNNY